MDVHVPDPSFANSRKQWSNTTKVGKCLPPPLGLRPTLRMGVTHCPRDVSLVYRTSHGQSGVEGRRKPDYRIVDETFTETSETEVVTPYYVSGVGRRSVPDQGTPDGFVRGPGVSV